MDRPSVRSEITWDRIASEAGPADPELTPQQFIGMQLFRWVMIALGVGALLLAGYGVLTWPTPDLVANALGDATLAERTAALRELRADWHEQTRQTAAVVLVGPMMTLLSAIIGYVLGRESGGR